MLEELRNENECLRDENERLRTIIRSLSEMDAGRSVLVQMEIEIKDDHKIRANLIVCHPVGNEKAMTRMIADQLKYLESVFLLKEDEAKETG